MLGSKITPKPARIKIKSLGVVLVPRISAKRIRATVAAISSVELWTASKAERVRAILIVMLEVILAPARAATSEIKFSSEEVISGVELAPAKFVKRALEIKDNASDVVLWTEMELGKSLATVWAISGVELAQAISAMKKIMP